MNKFILKIMRQIDNPKLFTNDQMVNNAKAAYLVAVHANTVNTVNTVYANYVNIAAKAAVDDVDEVKYWVAKFFEFTGEDKQDYINEVERLR